MTRNLTRCDLIATCSWNEGMKSGGSVRWGASEGSSWTERGLKAGGSAEPGTSTRLPINNSARGSGRSKGVQTTQQREGKEKMRHIGHAL